MSGLLLDSTPAVADTAPPAAGAPATVSSDPLPTVQVNGVVWAQIVVGNTVYATGQFSKARPAGSAAGSNETPRSNLLAYDITTGVLKTGFAPTLNAQGLALAASPDGQTVYVGGDFTQINGQNKYRLAALDATTGALRNFTPDMDARVRALAVNGTTLYVGGNFSTAANQPRTRLAAFNTTNSQLLPWAPAANREVYALAVHSASNKVFVGGKFDTVNGATNRGSAALDGGTAASMPFSANTVAYNSGNSAGIYSLKVAGDSVYGTGWNFDGSAPIFESVFSADAATGQLRYVSGCAGDTYDSLPVAGVLYTVAHNHNCTPVGGWPEQGGLARRAFAFRLDPVPGKTNGPGAYGTFQGQPAPELLHWYPDMATGSYTGQNQAAWSLAGNSTYVAVGGEFPTVNGGAQQGLVRYAVRATAPNTDAPRGYDTLTPSLSPSATGVQATFTAAFDRDNARLTYELLRGAQLSTATVVATTTSDTNFWTRPQLSLTDPTPPTGSQSYRIRAKDPLGNQLISQTVVVNTSEQNLAVGKPSTQVSVDYGGDPARAVDGKPTATTTAAR